MIHVHGNIIEKKSGWITLHIYGSAYERGFAHGFLLSDEFVRIQKTFPFLVEEQIGVSFKKYMKKSNDVIYPIVKKKFPEFFEEIRGISEGLAHSGKDISIEYLIAWNSYVTLYSDFKIDSLIKCSAFIATGNATENGEIVMGHNTHCDFATSQVFNVMIYLTPSAGTPFVMQTCAGYIASATDWFICANGMIGCETTITKINYKPKFGTPYFCRIRQAMQYGNSLDEYTQIMLKENAGDYACSWLFGNVHTNEIMLFELGLTVHSVQRKKNGLFYGMNSAIDETLREKETFDVSHDDPSTSCGSRNIRLKQLLYEKYYGSINLNNAKLILSDHYDVGLGKKEMNSKGICKHNEMDENSKYFPFGSTDVKVVNSSMAREMKFLAKFGSGCNRPFFVDEFIKENPRYKKWKNVLVDMPTRRYIEIHNDRSYVPQWISTYMPNLFTRSSQTETLQYFGLFSKNYA